ncbi:beta-propeller fold lactonase family protein [Amycolatopsis sp. PS_44_ISF1]|uniref:lactonase family protein n=1 Tax=Amycolatopsis sp. PS_44_ISF1 TaxID=2974917 RepID=UPI0028DD98DC|nr:beta-propeller fold lactonase family protein [Amycolatopsis sp. PS_44_ISF1]MDT8910679.1 lactonase family protein [Amycolatopsis sp. PS_44_ISF1]
MTELVLVGCYTAETGGNGDGISAFRRGIGGALTLETTLPMVSPSWLVKHPTVPMVYAANETGSGEVTSVSLAGGELEALDVVGTGGADPCHLAVTPGGRFLVCANYTGGSLAVFALSPDGRIDERTDLVRHQGHGPDAERQAAAHVHMAVPSPDGSVVSAVDLGTDEIRSYALSTEGRLTPLAVTALPPGTGPRQLVRRPGTTTAYVVGELAGTLLTLRETAPGAFEVTDSVRSSWAEPEVKNLAAHLEIVEDALYLSNRGPDCVTAFTGTTPSAVADQACGAGPRHFALVDGRCYVAAQDEDAIIAFPLSELGEAEPERYPSGSPSFVLAATV